MGEEHRSARGTEGSGRRRVGHWYLMEPLGTTPLVELWAGVDRSGEPVAVTVLRPEVAADPTVVARFAEECSLASRLTDPHLVRVLDFVVDDEPAVVSEHLDGPTLDEVLVHQPTLPPYQALNLCADVLNGLATLHAFGVVHRAVSPETIWVTEDQGRARARLGDHALGWLHDGWREGGRPLAAVEAGTAHYRAPETVRGHRPSEASDVYAVGVVLHRLLVGVVPHVQLAGDQAAPGAPVKPASVSEAVWIELAELLDPSPAVRPSAEAAARRLEALASEVAGAPAAHALQHPPRPAPELVDAAEPAQPVATGGSSSNARARRGGRSAHAAPLSDRRRHRVAVGAVVASSVVAVGGGTTLVSALAGEDSAAGLRSAVAADIPRAKRSAATDNALSAAPVDPSSAPPGSDSIPGSPVVPGLFGTPVTATAAPRAADDPTDDPDATPTSSPSGAPSRHVTEPTTTPVSPSLPAAPSSPASPTSPGQPGPERPTTTPTTTPRPPSTPGPPVTQPPEQEPPVEEPPVEEPPVQDPPVQDPPVEDPPVQDPPDEPVEPQPVPEEVDGGERFRAVGWGRGARSRAQERAAYRQLLGEMLSRFATTSQTSGSTPRPR